MNSNTVNILLSIFSFVLAVISVVTVVITILQNKKMIESATRPILAFYTSVINTGASPTIWFVAKNYGQSVAKIKKLTADKDFEMFLLGCNQLPKERIHNSNPIFDLQDASLAPGQSRACALDFQNCPDSVRIDVEYISPVGKQYIESFDVALKAGNRMLTYKSAGSNNEKDIKNISYTLQEMLQKSL